MNLFCMLVPILVPVVAGVLILCLGKKADLKTLCGISVDVLLFSLVFVVGNALRMNSETEYVLFSFTEQLQVVLKLDVVGKIFSCLMAFIWTLVALYSGEYMKEEKDWHRYFGFFVMTLGVLIGLDYAGNLLTYYVLFEFMTLLSFPLVLHEMTHESIMAALKYLFYSLGGAFMVLFGLFYFSTHGVDTGFAAGGTGTGAAMMTGGMLAAVFVTVLGFSVKAGMFPLHAWLPTAHPVAPAPASAVLSAVITKGGVLGILRVLYFVFSPELLSGTWVQTALLTLSLITVFMGSMLAFREKLLKKRLAYSTVSQVSYVLFGLFCLNTGDAFTGALLQVVCHALVKSALFLCAGAIIYRTGKKYVSELDGIGKQMPVTMFFFTLASLSLVGIPPTGGFIAKWYLAVGALNCDIPVFSVLGPAVLLISALLTAGYLFPISIQGYLPEAREKVKGAVPEKSADITENMTKEDDTSVITESPESVSIQYEKKETNWLMLFPIGCMSLAALFVGLFPGIVTQLIGQIF
ncbi:MAG: proton-conducting membrane transporter [Lachnospiraceae bacterium]|nr:proton-conducting membrane transporter [Lachnospiraceae bacterium]